MARSIPGTENADFNRGYNCGWETCEALHGQKNDPLFKDGFMQALSNEVKRLKRLVLIFSTLFGGAVGLAIYLGVSR